MKATTTTTTTTANDCSAAVEWEERVRIVRQHYQDKGYRVHSGLQFGCELVLYADDPSKVHSDFCVHVVPAGAFCVHGLVLLRRLELFIASRWETD